MCLGVLHSKRSDQREGGGCGKHCQMPMGMSGEEEERTIRGTGKRGCSVPEGRGEENCNTEGVGLSQVSLWEVVAGPSLGAYSAGQTCTGPEPLQWMEMPVM